MAIILPIIVLLAAFAINVAYLELTRTEMYIAADASSRATCRQLAITGDVNQAMATGRAAANLNPVNGKALQLANSDFSFGQSARTSLSSRYTFTPGGTPYNSVEVTVQKAAASANGPIQMLVPLIFGTANVESSQTSRSNQIEVDIALVVDRSGSMAYADTEKAVYPPLPAACPPGWKFGDAAPTPCRWRDAVNAVNVFLTELTNSLIDEWVTLVTYDGTTNIDTPLTNKYNVTQSGMDVYTQHFNSDLTNIGGGIDAGHAATKAPGSRPYAAKIMLVLTDGIDTVGSNPVASATSCAADKIMVFTITFAQEADQATMAAVAAAASGKHYHASTGADLQAIFQDIAHQLPILISR